MNPAVKKLLRFIEQPECQHYLNLAHESYLAEFAEAHDLDDADDLYEAVGEAAMANIMPCVLEFFFSNDYMKDGQRWNVIDLFLKKRSALLNDKDKGYLRSLRQSHMSLYEVLEIEPENSILLRDLIEGGEPVRVFEKSFGRQISVWDVVGVRVCGEAGRFVLGGGALVLDREAGTELAKNIRGLQAAGMEFLRTTANDLDGGGYSNAEKERLMKVMWAKEISLGYLEDSFKKLNRKIEFCNSDGDPLQYYTMTFPLKADWKEIAARINTVEDYHQDEDGRARKFWNWCQPMDTGLRPSEDRGDVFMQTIETTLDADDLDGPVRVLGTIELRKTKMVAEANSLNRAKRLETRLVKLLGSSIGSSVWKKAETPSGKSAKEIGGARKAKPLPEPDISPEEQTEIMHAMFMQHYHGWLTTPVPALGNKTPKELSKTEAGRNKLVEALKGVENSVRHLERQSGITSPLDLGWMWKELGVARDRVA